MEVLFAGGTPTPSQRRARSRLSGRRAPAPRTEAKARGNRLHGRGRPHASQPRRNPYAARRLHARCTPSARQRLREPIRPLSCGAWRLHHITAHRYTSAAALLEYAAPPHPCGRKLIRNFIRVALRHILPGTGARERPAPAREATNRPSGQTPPACAATAQRPPLAARSGLRATPRVRRRSSPGSRHPRGRAYGTRTRQPPVTSSDLTARAFTIATSGAVAQSRRTQPA